MHPLVSVIHMENAEPRKLRKTYYGLYAIFLKQVKCGDLKYGMKNYDYQEGTLMFIGPGQVFGKNREEIYQPQGSALVFHPDLLHGTTLAKTMSEYSFFSYASNEALHLSDQEKKIILDCFAKIEYEIAHAIDKHSKKLIVSNIELLLDYCMRFYDRQFITRNHINGDILVRFEKLLNDYFKSADVQLLGLPSVAWCAGQLYLSSNNLCDLIKKETGHTALDYIQSKLIDEAKIRLFDRNQTISEIAFELGFKYQQHFTRLFKQKVGVTPNAYRNLN